MKVKLGGEGPNFYTKFIDVIDTWYNGIMDKSDCVEYPTTYIGGVDDCSYYLKIERICVSSTVPAIALAVETFKAVEKDNTDKVIAYDVPVENGEIALIISLNEKSLVQVELGKFYTGIDTQRANVYKQSITNIKSIVDKLKTNNLIKHALVNLIIAIQKDSEALLNKTKVILENDLKNDITTFDKGLQEYLKLF